MRHERIKKMKNTKQFTRLYYLRKNLNKTIELIEEAYYNGLNDELVNLIYLYLINLQRTIRDLNDEYLSLSINNIVSYFEDIDEEIENDVLNIVDYYLNDILIRL